MYGCITHACKDLTVFTHCGKNNFGGKTTMGPQQCFQWESNQCQYGREICKRDSVYKNTH